MDSLDRVLTWLAAPPSLRPRLDLYAEWLGSEALTAGGIGPDEGSRVLERHVVDSLLFAGVWSNDGAVLDVGSGVGLPGIPLAIVAPHRRFLLIDRSARRVALARRAVRILGLENVDVVQADVEDIDWDDKIVVSRASLTPTALRDRANRVGGPLELLVAGSHVVRPDVPGYETIEIPSEILDHPAWILRMAQS